MPKMVKPDDLHADCPACERSGCVTVYEQAEYAYLLALLRSACYRLQCIAEGQHGDQLIMNPAEYARASLSLIEPRIEP